MSGVITIKKEDNFQAQQKANSYVQKLRKGEGYLHFYMPRPNDIFLKQNCVYSKRGSRLPSCTQECFSKFIRVLHNPHALKNKTDETYGNLQDMENLKYI